MAADEENGVAERLKAVADALEEIVADRSLLKELSLEERTRLLALAGDVHNPDVDVDAEADADTTTDEKEKV